MDHRMQIERLGSKPTDSGLQSLVPTFPRSRVPARERLIVALDVPTLEGAARFVTTLAPAVRWFKVGSELFTAVGPRAITMILERGGNVFLDLKFHDIPRTVAAAVGAAARLGVHMMNVHIAAGEETLRAAVRALDDIGPVTSHQSPVTSVRITNHESRITRPLLLGVTQLTSHQDGPEVMAAVVDAAARAKWCGLDGVVASAREAAAIKSACGREFVVGTPGIRPAAASSEDQRRTATPAEAVLAGADHLVVGRPVLDAADPLAVVSGVTQEMEAAVRQESGVSERNSQAFRLRGDGDGSQ